MALLRDNAFRIGMKETQDAALLLASPANGSPHLLRGALKPLCCANHDDWLKFDRLFDAFYLRHGQRIAGVLVGTPPERQQRGRRLGDAAGAQDQQARDADEANPADTQDDANPADSRSQRRNASSAQALMSRDVRHIADAEDIEKAQALAQRLARLMRTRLTRRLRLARRGQKLDLRRTLHRSIASGGEPLQQVWRIKKPKPLRLVMLMDASGSMALYTPWFARFMHGAVHAFRRAEAYVFHTQIANIGAVLKDRDLQRALDRLGLVAQGMGGGTRIAGCLADFNRYHARRALRGRTLVMIFSDGFDTGVPGALAHEMRRLRQRCRRILWLNPLIGWKDYAPEARGMREALPFIDHFAAAHSLESLAALEPWLTMQ
ncbi:MAG: VWA domain-containing protein [Hyphomicrobiales bacterium]|nr:VWA domain-containing protein [Hyphomicrobiales bacterium]